MHVNDVDNRWLPYLYLHERNVVRVDLGVVIHGHTIAVGISQLYGLLKAMVGQGIFNLSLWEDGRTMRGLSQQSH